MVLKKRKIRVGKKTQKHEYFYCPGSPHILWHHGFRYKDCPLNKRERDSRECENCELQEK